MKGHPTWLGLVLTCFLLGCSQKPASEKYEPPVIPPAPRVQLPSPEQLRAIKLPKDSPPLPPLPKDFKMPPPPNTTELPPWPKDVPVPPPPPIPVPEKRSPR